MGKADRVKQAIVERLPGKAQADTSDLTVSVAERDVTLEGTVSNDFARQAIVSAASEIFAGHRIRDHMVVRFSATSTTPSGEELRSAIHSLFGWVPGLDVSTPEVCLKNGVIIVTGSVESSAEKEKLGEAIRNYFGVVDLENRLVVAPAQDSRHLQERQRSSSNRSGDES